MRKPQDRSARPGAFPVARHRDPRVEEARGVAIQGNEGRSSTIQIAFWSSCNLLQSPAQLNDPCV